MYRAYSRRASAGSSVPLTIARPSGKIVNSRSGFRFRKAQEVAIRGNVANCVKANRQRVEIELNRRVRVNLNRVVTAQDRFRRDEWPIEKCEPALSATGALGVRLAQRQGAKAEIPDVDRD